MPFSLCQTQRNNLSGTKIINLVKFSQPFTLETKMIDPPLHDFLDVELMCSEGETSKLRTGLSSPLSPSVTQTGACWPGLQPLAPSLPSFSTGGQTMCLGPEHPFNQGGSWLGATPMLPCSSPGRDETCLGPSSGSWICCRVWHWFAICKLMDA